MESGQKKNRLYNKIVNIVVIIVVALVAIIAITRVISYSKGYNSLFGTAFIAVETDSMKGNYKDSFQRGDLLFVDVLDDSEKLNLQIGDVITFRHYDETLRKEIVITHRIVNVTPYGEANVLTTHGDANKDGGNETVFLGSVIGLYKSHIGGIGYLPIFFASQWGFFSIVVIPCFLVVLYCVYRVFRSFQAYNKEKTLSTAGGGEIADLAPQEKDSKIAELEAQLKALQAQKKSAKEETKNTEEGVKSAEGQVKPKKRVSKSTDADMH